jgi:hypothetical protein
LPQFVVERDHRGPVQQLAGERNVGLALHGIVGRQRAVFHPRGRPGDLDDLLGELADRKLGGSAQVDRPGHVVGGIDQSIEPVCAADRPYYRSSNDWYRHSPRR